MKVWVDWSSVSEELEKDVGNKRKKKMNKERINELIKSYLDVEINDGSWQLGLMSIEVGETSMTVSSRKVSPYNLDSKMNKI